MMLALPIFPGRLQPSIVSAVELNFRVRDGNGWTLTAISTNYSLFRKKSKQKKQIPLSSPYRSFNGNHHTIPCSEKQAFFGDP